MLGGSAARSLSVPLASRRKAMMRQSMDRWWKWLSVALMMTLLLAGCAKDEKAKKAKADKGPPRRPT